MIIDEVNSLIKRRLAIEEARFWQNVDDEQFNMFKKSEDFIFAVKNFTVEKTKK